VQQDIKYSQLPLAAEGNRSACHVKKKNYQIKNGGEVSAVEQKVTWKWK